MFYGRSSNPGIIIDIFKYQNTIGLNVTTKLNLTAKLLITFGIMLILLLIIRLPIHSKKSVILKR